jgi:hypothetical protein
MRKLSWFLALAIVAMACQTENVAPNLSEKIDLNFNKNAFANARVGTGYKACGTPSTHKLMAGQNIPVGEVTVFNDGDVMYVTVSIEKGEGFDQGDWFIRKIHGYFGQVESDFVTKGKKGMRNPAPGQFPINETITLDYGNANQEFTYELEISDFLRDLGEFDVAIHAEVVKVTDIDYNNNTATIVKQESAWAGDQLFNPSGTGNWATFISYTVQDCAVACQDEWLRYTSYTDDGATGEENEETVESESFIVKDVGFVEFQRVRTNLAGSARRYTITIDYSIFPELISQGYSFESFTAFTKGRLEDGATLASKTNTGTHTEGQIVLTYDVANAGGNAIYWQGFNAVLNGLCNP